MTTVSDGCIYTVTELAFTYTSQYYSKTGCDGMGICCEKKTVIG